MAEAATVDGFDGLVRHILATETLPSTFTPNDLTVKPYGGADDRIGWAQTGLVLVYGIPVGYCDAHLPDPPALPAWHPTYSREIL